MSYNSSPPQYQPQYPQQIPPQPQGMSPQQQGMSLQQQGLPSGLPSQQLPPQQQGYSPQQHVFVQQHQGFSPQQGIPQEQNVYAYPPQQGVPAHQQQPMMYAATTQMNPQVVIKQAPQREWRFGLFDCFADATLCLKTTFCSCITYGENKEKLSSSPGSCATHALAYCCVEYCLGLGCILGAMARNEARIKYQIDGSGIGDACTHICCGCCALIQENRE
ncbi:9767_t:CDS:2, partial [Funneliformis geosporum]